MYKLNCASAENALFPMQVNKNTLLSFKKLQSNKYKKIFDSLPDVKLLHLCLKILSKEDSEFDNCNKLCIKKFTSSEKEIESESSED